MVALILIESANNPLAVSPAGAVGLTQVTPIAAKQVQQDNGLYPSTPNLFDPEVSLWYGKKYLEYCMDQTWNVEEALACFNGGMTQVNRARRGRRMVRETREYVKKVMSSWFLEKTLRRKGKD